MANLFKNPASFENAVGQLAFRLAQLDGRVTRTSATYPVFQTFAQLQVGLSGRIVDFRMRVIDTATTSSTTFNTIQLVKLPVGTTTAITLSTLTTFRGASNTSTGGSGGFAAPSGTPASRSNAVAVPPSGASQLVAPGDLLVLLKKTKLNTNCQIFASVLIDREIA